MFANECSRNIETFNKIQSGRVLFNLSSLWEWSTESFHFSLAKLSLYFNVTYWLVRLQLSLVLTVEPPYSDRALFPDIGRWVVVPYKESHLVGRALTRPRAHGLLPTSAIKSHIPREPPRRWELELGSARNKRFQLSHEMSNQDTNTVTQYCRISIDAVIPDGCYKVTYFADWVSRLCCHYTHLRTLYVNLN